MHTCCNLGLAPSKSILSVDERERGDVVARDHRESDGNFDKDHRTNPSNLSFIRETIPLVARLPGWPNYTEKTEAPFPIKARSSRAHNAFRRCSFPFGSFSLFFLSLFFIGTALVESGRESHKNWSFLFLWIGGGLSSLGNFFSPFNSLSITHTARLSSSRLVRWWKALKTLFFHFEAAVEREDFFFVSFLILGRVTYDAHPRIDILAQAKIFHNFQAEMRASCRSLSSESRPSRGIKIFLPRGASEWLYVRGETTREIESETN